MAYTDLEEFLESEEVRSIFLNRRSSFEILTNYVRSTTTSVCRRRSASISSRALIDWFNLILCFHRFPEDECDIHTIIPNFPRYVDLSHSLVIEALNLWLTRKFESFPFTVHSETSLGNLSKCVPQIFTSETKIVDVVIKSRSSNFVIIQFEVVWNNDVQATRLKLAFGLCDQLRYIMNHSNVDENISVCGFVVPVARRGFIELVECRFDNKSFNYIVDFTSSEIQEADFFAQISRIAFKQKHDLEQTVGCENKGFSVPIVISDLMKTKFGADVKQLKSGSTSIVLASQDNNAVYKKCFDHNQNSRLLNYLHNNFASDSIAKDHVCFPMAIVFCFENFIQFPMLTAPFERSEVRQHLKFFCLAVFIAITKLHLAGLAHLDIRLENICFKPDVCSSRAVLIDLDRSCPVHEPYRYSVQYGDSKMYECEDVSWTNEHMDWKQFGILLYSIVNDFEDYHAINIPKSNPMGFLEKLFHSGILDDTLLRQWIVNLTT